MIDISQAVLVTDSRNKNILITVVENLVLYCGITKVVVICPDKDVSVIEKVLAQVKIITPVCLLPDSHILNFSVSDIQDRRIPGFPSRAGWYYQQFLKLGFSFHPSAQENFLIWDADTIPLRPLSFTKKNRILFTVGNEYFPQYFRLIPLLLGFESPLKVSTIAQHSVFNRDEVREMLAKMCPETIEVEWPNKILAICEQSRLSFFSEYEIYAAYSFNQHPDRSMLIERKWFRNGAAVAGYPPSRASLKILGVFFDFCSFELWDQTTIRKAKGWIKLFLQLSGYRFGKKC